MHDAFTFVFKQDFATLHISSFMNPQDLIKLNVSKIYVTGPAKINHVSA